MRKLKMGEVKHLAQDNITSKWQSEYLNPRLLLLSCVLILVVTLECLKMEISILKQFFSMPEPRAWAWKSSNSVEPLPFLPMALSSLGPLALDPSRPLPRPPIRPAVPCGAPPHTRLWSQKKQTCSSFLPLFLALAPSQLVFYALSLICWKNPPHLLIGQ